MISLINRARRQAAGSAGTGVSYALDDLASPSLVIGSWCVEKAHASDYAASNPILGAKMFTTGTEADFDGVEVEAGDVLTWNADTKAVITDVYDQMGGGLGFFTNTLSNMPVYIDSSAHLTLDDGSKTMEFSGSGSGLYYVGLGMTGTDGAVIVKLKGGADTSYKILRIAGDRSPAITLSGSGSACYSHTGTPNYEITDVPMTTKTRGQLHTEISGNDVILYIYNIDWSANSGWNTGTVEMCYDGDARISAMTIWDSAPPAGDIALIKAAYALS